MQKLFYKKEGFTLMEMIIIIAIIAILIAAMITVIDPEQQGARVRNAKREADLKSLYDAIPRRLSENTRARWDCDSGSFPQELDEGEPVFVSIGNGVGQYDLCQCITPGQLYNFPVDPSVGTIDNPSSCAGSYSSGYEMWQNPNTQILVLKAPHAERGELIGINLDEI